MDIPVPQGLDLRIARDFVIALFIGALIGVEREFQKGSEDQQFGGLRTFALCAVMGALAGELALDDHVPVTLVAGLLGLAGLLGVTVFIEGRERRRVPGLTTEVAALVTYLLGGAVALGHAEAAVMVAIATSAVLTFKQPLHAAVRAMGRDDIVAGLKLLAATFIVLPLIPDRALDPWGALNPWKLWLLVLLISGLSLVGYVAMRLLGARRGVAVTGFFGGLVSSTAVTLTLSRRSREMRGIDDALAVGVLLSWSVMSVRVVIEVAVVAPALLRSLLAPVAAMLAASVILLAVFYRRAAAPGNGEAAGGERPAVALKNPFSLTAAVQFALFFAAILVAVQLARLYLPASYLYGVAALAGATDVDAITLSLAELAVRDPAHGAAALAILIAAWSNTALKCVLVLATGSAGLRARAAVAAGAVIAAGAAGVALS